VLCSAPSSSRYRGANPSSSRYRGSNRGSAPSSSRYRGANSGFGTLLESLSRCQPWVQQTGLVCPTHTPVAIVVQTLGSTSSSSCYRGANPSSSHYRGANPSSSRYRGANPSSSHYRGSNRGRDSRWQMVVCVSVHTVANGCVCFSPYCKDSGFRLGSRTGGKLTCRNSKTARNRGFVVVFARSKPVNPVPYCGLKRRNP